MRLRCRKEGEPMRTFRTRKQFLVFFMPGFLLGIIYVNFIAAKYMAEPGIFSEYFLDQFDSVKIEVGEYIWYLLRVRALPFLALVGIAFTKMRKAAAVLFLFWTGISGGILISTAVLNLGIRGSLLCLAGLSSSCTYLLIWFYCGIAAQRLRTAGTSRKPYLSFWQCQLEFCWNCM